MMINNGKADAHCNPTSGDSGLEPLGVFLQSLSVMHSVACSERTQSQSTEKKFCAPMNLKYCYILL